MTGDTRRSALEIAAIAAPFAIVLIAFRGLALTFPTFHGSDETIYHYLVIRDFYAQWPAPQLANYHSATAPLFHLLLAAIALVTGPGLQTLRLVNLALSVAAVLVFRRLLRPSPQRLLCVLVFAMSPYFFGASFILLTDDVALLFVLLALFALLEDVRRASLRSWALFCVAAAAATLTRQLHVWLVVAGVAALASRDMSRRTARLALLAASCAPLIGLIALWRGLVPPQFQTHHAASAVDLRATAFGLAIAGLYGSLLCPAQAIAMVRRFASTASHGVIWLAGSWFVVLACRVRPLAGDDGALWRVSRHLPAVAGSGLLFWILVPLGIGFLYAALVSRDRIARILGAAAIAFVAVNSANATIYEKYFDPTLIALVFLVGNALAADEPGSPSSSRWSGLARILVLVAFCAYPLVSWRLTAS